MYQSGRDSVEVGCIIGGDSIVSGVRVRPLVILSIPTVLPRKCVAPSVHVPSHIRSHLIYTENCHIKIWKKADDE